MSHISPLEVVQAQLDAYNAKDMEALLATYMPNAEQYATGGVLLAKGHEQIRPRFLARFAEPTLYARLMSRQVVGQRVCHARRRQSCHKNARGLPEGWGLFLCRGRIFPRSNATRLRSPCSHHCRQLNRRVSLQDIH